MSKPQVPVLRARHLAALVGLAWLSLACQPQGKEGAREYQLEATAEQQAAAIRVTGQANLPDKAQVLIALVDPRQPQDANQAILVQEFGNIQQERFVGVLKRKEPIPPGAYQIRLIFSPTAFDWSGGVVTQQVGEKGQHLAGKYVKEEKDGTKYLENMIPFTYKEVK